MPDEFPIHVHYRTFTSRRHPTSEGFSGIIITDNEKSLVFKRTSIKRGLGVMTVKTFTDVERAINFFTEIKSDFERQHHVVGRSTEHSEVQSAAEIKKAIGTINWTYLGKSNVSFLLPKFNVSGICEPPKPPAALERDPNAARTAIRSYPDRTVNVAEEIAKNPNWGMF